MMAAAPVCGGAESQTECCDWRGEQPLGPHRWQRAEPVERQGTSETSAEIGVGTHAPGTQSEEPGSTPEEARQRRGYEEKSTGGSAEGL
ncbi:hypothetical protein NDU88_001398 [Pleurodeles waltl]|uniref:Uncharacterized protein n=1 Tax=Pleurodeles waltl TaxID=8319 RepID=A0AAV7U688_PLEWA|nr:hypothetical protein NDU88_001398 [Pleurodeles waltl]